MPSGSARVAGVMGWPVAHSRSPRIHGYWLREYRIDGVYVPLAVRPHHLERALRALPALGFAGVNLTLPHKQAALALMDDLDDAARRIGAVNTVVVDPAGRLHGRNSDSGGFLESLRAGAPGCDPTAAPVVVLGAGGAARAIVHALDGAGAPAIRVVNRSAARAASLATSFGGGCVAWPVDDLSGALAGAGLLVNATSLGMSGQPALDIDLAALPAAATVLDIVYQPLETPLLAAARARGNIAVDGLGMLLHQARPGFAAWFGVDPAVTPALRRSVLGDAVP